MVLHSMPVETRVDGHNAKEDVGITEMTPYNYRAQTVSIVQSTTVEHAQQPMKPRFRVPTNPSPSEMVTTLPKQIVPNNSLFD